MARHTNERPGGSEAWLTRRTFSGLGSQVIGSQVRVVGCRCRSGSTERATHSAKVQIGAELLCKGAKVKGRAQGETGGRIVSWGIWP